jgi:putative phosphoesterase
MRIAIDRENPGAIFHLGDHDSDAYQLKKEFPNIPMYSVSGNCDLPFPIGPDSLLVELEGVRIFAAHGHNHSVKYGQMRFYMATKEKEAQLGLFGHSHSPFCECQDNVWLLNPGTCKGYYGATYGVAYVHQGEVVRCEIKRI